MPETSMETSPNPTKLWTEEVVGLVTEAAVTFFAHGPDSEPHQQAARQLWAALEVARDGGPALRGGGDDPSAPVASAQDGGGAGLARRAGDDTNCVRCGRGLTAEAVALGQVECSAHKHGKVEFRSRPARR